MSVDQLFLWMVGGVLSSYQGIYGPRGEYHIESLIRRFFAYVHDFSKMTTD